MRISDWSSDVCSSDLLTTLILPFPCAQLAFYIDLAALAQEAFSDIDQAFRENSDSVPFGPVLALARIPILPAFAGRDADIADLAAILEAANFRLRAKIPDQNHLVDVACHIVYCRLANWVAVSADGKSVRQGKRVTGRVTLG